MFNITLDVKFMKDIFSAGTPLSALFRIEYHEELAAVIESWRPFLIDDDPTVDVLKLYYFKVDRRRLRAKEVYLDLLALVDKNALKVSMRWLARYLSNHSNLSVSYSSLYQQLRRLHAQTK